MHTDFCQISALYSERKEFGDIDMMEAIKEKKERDKKERVEEEIRMKFGDGIGSPTKLK